jgi:MFS family permease
MTEPPERPPAPNDLPGGGGTPGAGPPAQGSADLADGDPALGLDRTRADPTLGSDQGESEPIVMGAAGPIDVEAMVDTAALASAPEHGVSTGVSIAPLTRHPDFLKLWSAETISVFGTQITQLAVPLVAALILDASPFEFALLGTVQMLPFIFLSLPAGVWVDRMRRRPIMIAGDLGRAALLATIPLAYAMDVLSMLHLYVVGLAVGTLTVFFDVAYQSYLPSVVDRRQLVDGNAKLEISRSAAQIGGPGLAGILVGAITAPLAILVDAVSYVGSALLLVWIRKPEPAPEHPVDEHGKRTSMRHEIAEGLRYVLGNRSLRAIALTTGSTNLITSMVFAIFVLYQVRELGLDAATIGVILGLGNIGALAAAITVGRVSSRLGVGRTIVLAIVLDVPAAWLLVLAPTDFPAPFLVAAGVLVGIAAIYYNVNQVSFRQAITPPAMQGRMNATMRFIVWGTMPIGSLLGGVLGEAIGLREVVVLGAVLMFVPLVPLLLSPVPSIREMPEPEPA